MRTRELQTDEKSPTRLERRALKREFLVTSVAMVAVRKMAEGRLQEQDLNSFDRVDQSRVALCDPPSERQR